MYPFLGMGIAFREVSEENRARVREMVASVAAESGCPIVGSTEPARADVTTSISNAATVVQALTQLFETKTSMSREEFHQFVRQAAR